MQEQVISALAKEVRQLQSNYGGNKSKTREKLIEVAQKQLELETLQRSKEQNLPEIEKQKMDAQRLKGLQEDEIRLKMEFQSL